SGLPCAAGRRAVRAIDERVPVGAEPVLPAHHAGEAGEGTVLSRRGEARSGARRLGDGIAALGQGRRNDGAVGAPGARGRAGGRVEARWRLVVPAHVEVDVDRTLPRRSGGEARTGLHQAGARGGVLEGSGHGLKRAFAREMRVTVAALEE